MMHDTNEGFVSVSGRRTMPAELAVTYPKAEGLARTNSFGALSAVSSELPKSTSLQDPVDDAYTEYYGPNKGTPHHYKELFDREVQVVGRAVAQVATPPPPAMLFAQLMALATTTAESVATTNTHLRALATESATMNAQLRALATESATTKATAKGFATSIASQEASIQALTNQIGDLNRSVCTSIICIENTIGTNESAIKRLAADIPPLHATIGDIETKVDEFRQDINRHVDDIAALKPIVDSVWYGQLGAIRENVRQVESKSGADYTMVSDGVTRLKKMFFEGLDKVNIRVDDLIRTHPSHTTPPGALPAALHPSAGLPPNPERAPAPNNALANTGLQAPNNALANTDSDVCGDGHPLAGCVGSDWAPSERHPLYPTTCDFAYDREAAVHGCLDPRVNARPQGRNSSDTGCQGSGFTPRLGLVYDRLLRAYGSRDVTAPPDHRQYSDIVDAESGHKDEAYLLQGGEIISPCHWDCRQEAQSAGRSPLDAAALGCQEDHGYQIPAGVFPTYG